MNFDDWRGCITPVITCQVCDSYHQQGSCSSEKVGSKESNRRAQRMLKMNAPSEIQPLKNMALSTLSATFKKSKQMLLNFSQSHSSSLCSRWMRWDNREAGGSSPWVKGCVMLGNRVKPKEY